MSTYDMETTIQLPDEEDVDVNIWFEVTYWGYPGCGPSLSDPGSPPEGPEFSLTKVVRLDTGENIFNEVMTLPDDYWEKVQDLVFHKICEIDEDRSYDE